MIELYDRERLDPRRDRSLPVVAALALAVVAAVGGWSALLYTRVQAVEAQARELQARVGSGRQPAAAAATPIALAELQRQVERLEAEAAGAARGGALLAPSQWLDRLAGMASAEVSLSRIEIDRGGAARIEGQAASPQALARFVQEWERQEPQATVLARSLELRQDKGESPRWRFQMRATPPEPRS